MILTGASKGFGQALACSLAREFSQNTPGKESVLVLVARSKKGLDETQRMVAKISSDLNGWYTFGNSQGRGWGSVFL